MITTPLLSILRARGKQKYRTLKYPNGSPPLPDRFLGKPVISSTSCPKDCTLCITSCPVAAIQKTETLHIDMGVCLFCGNCVEACPNGTIRFSKDFHLASQDRGSLVIQQREGGDNVQESTVPSPRRDKIQLFRKSFKLRQVSAGGCNACELDCNVLSTVAWDMGRFGIQFVASPRHADGILVTGPVTENMKVALEKTYRAVPSPKVVIAVGSCAISGGPYKDHPEQMNGVSSLLPVDLFIPGCPPHPLVILEGLLRFLGRI
ncbi:MAG: 4Fe-4S dicluster domain-containing protein [Spirochaetes bacterium]|nr:4Fe-4S dicluster domain-containing protein [Spirochaetota bacterium]